MDTLTCVPQASSINVLEGGRSYHQWDVLIVSARTENGKALMRILADLPVNVFRATTIGQAREVVAKHPIEVIFLRGVPS